MKHALLDLNEKTAQVNKNSDFLKRQYNEISRQQNEVLKKKHFEEHKQFRNNTLIMALQNQTANIEGEIAKTREKIQNDEKKIITIQKDITDLDDALAETRSIFTHAQDDFKDLQVQRTNQYAEVQTFEKKIVKERQIYEEARSQREKVSKNLIEAQGEIQKLDVELNKLRIAIEQTKTLIRRQDRTRITDKHYLDMLKIEIGQYQTKVIETVTQCETISRAMASHQAELSKLQKTIANAELQLTFEQEKTNEIQRDKERIHEINIQKANELTRLAHQLTVLKNQCISGEKEFDTKFQQIELIREQVDESKEKLIKAIEIDTIIQERTKKIGELEKLYMNFQMERAAMENELQLPINIHNWTLLESRDPELFEKMKKYQNLQNEISTLTREENELKTQCENVEKQLILLQRSRSKTPTEQKKTLQELQEKAKMEMLDLEELTNELESYRHLAKHFKKEVDEVQKAIDKQRMKWVQDKKKALKEQIELQEQAAILVELGIKTIE